LRLGVRDLLECSTPPSPRDWPPLLKRPPQPSGLTLTDEYLMARVAASRPAGAIIVEEAPSTRGPLHDFLPILESDGYFTCASGGLGYGLPAAVGISLGREGRRIICILGDGSAMYSIQALWCASRLNLPISFLIVKNHSYAALIKFGRHFGLEETVGTQLPGLDFCAIASGHGVPALAVSAPSQLDPALETALSARGPFLVEVTVE
jgi:benzoylformate decarboxylase